MSVNLKEIHEFVERKCLAALKVEKEKDWCIIESKSSADVSFEFKYRHPLSFSRILYTVEKCQKDLIFGVSWQFIDDDTKADKSFYEQPLENKIKIAELLGYRTKINKEKNESN